MQINREVLQMALDALEICKADAEEEGFGFIQDHVIHALREALTQPEPEPDAWWLAYQTLGGDVGWRLSPTRSGAGVVNRLAGQENERALYLALPIEGENE